MSPDYFDVIDATWPAETYLIEGPWCLRQTKGAGSRVSCISALSSGASAQIERAEAAARAIGQTPLFMVKPGDVTLDAALEARGYGVEDASVIYALPIAPLVAEPMPYAKAFTIWPRLAILDDIWDAGGISPARRAVMDRAICPKTAVLGRAGDRAAGAAYLALHGNTAMIHAVEVVPAHRRKGVSGWILRAAAHWAAAQGGTEITMVTTRANGPANAAYTSQGARIVGHYHYRHAPEEAT
jgi:GNAT superfamily N-acetyltransferase